MYARASACAVIIIYLVFDLDRDLHRVLDRFLYRVLARVLAHFDPPLSGTGRNVFVIRSINSPLVTSSGSFGTGPVF
jgi:hypothetical protein